VSRLLKPITKFHFTVQKFSILEPATQCETIPLLRQCPSSKQSLRPKQYVYEMQCQTFLDMLCEYIHLSVKYRYNKRIVLQNIIYIICVTYNIILLSVFGRLHGKNKKTSLILGRLSIRSSDILSFA